MLAVKAMPAIITKLLTHLVNPIIFFWWKFIFIRWLDSRR